MVEALECLISDNSISTTAENMASLLNPKEATAQVAAAAAAATLAAAAAIAPASLRAPSPMAVGSGAAAAAAAELAATSAVAQRHQEHLQRGLQQQVAASINRHQQQLLQVNSIDSPHGQQQQQQQSPVTPGTSRSSVLSERSLGNAGSSPHMQQQQQHLGLQSPLSPSRHSSVLCRSALQHSALSASSSPNSPAAGVAAALPMPSEVSAEIAATCSPVDGSQPARSSLSRGNPAYETLQVVTDAEALGRPSSNTRKSPHQLVAAPAVEQQLQQQVQAGLQTPGKSKLGMGTQSTVDVDQTAASTSSVQAVPLSPARALPGTPSAAMQLISSPVANQVQGKLFADTTDEATQQQEGAETGAAVAESDLQVVQKRQDLSGLYGLALGASVCMADLIRQVSID